MNASNSSRPALRWLAVGAGFATALYATHAGFSWLRYGSVPMVVYTSFGGVQAVAWTDVKQMAVIVLGLFSAIAILVYGITRDVGFGQALRLAGATGRLQAIDTRFDLSQTYTLWSGLIGGRFLSLSYFGCDQSQVQRYLTAKSSSAQSRDHGSQTPSFAQCCPTSLPAFASPATQRSCGPCVQTRSAPPSPWPPPRPASRLPTLLPVRHSGGTGLSFHRASN